MNSFKYLKMTKELIRRQFQSSQIMPWRGGSNLSSLEIYQSESGTKGLDRNRYAMNLRKTLTRTKSVTLWRITWMSENVRGLNIFNFVFYNIQNWRWQKNCLNMFFLVLFIFLKSDTNFFSPGQWVTIPTQKWNREDSSATFLEWFSNIYIIFSYIQTSNLYIVST